MNNYRHITKVDPDKPLNQAQLDFLKESNTDAIIIGGTQGITKTKVSTSLDQFRNSNKPIWLEVSNSETIIPGFTGYLIPFVLNARNLDYLITKQHHALKEYGALLDFLPEEKTLAEGYIVLNPASSVAQKTQAQTNLTTKDCIAFTRLADRFFNMPIVYVEYSGTFGDMELLSEIRRVTKKARLFYGGGIDSYKKAKQAGEIADTIIVGNLLHSENYQKLEETILAVKPNQGPNSDS